MRVSERPKPELQPVMSQVSFLFGVVKVLGMILDGEYLLKEVTFVARKSED
jgi:hypothetical protein